MKIISGNAALYTGSARHILTTSSLITPDGLGVKERCYSQISVT